MDQPTDLPVDDDGEDVHREGSSFVVVDEGDDEDIRPPSDDEGDGDVAPPPTAFTNADAGIQSGGPQSWRMSRRGGGATPTSASAAYDGSPFGAKDLSRSGRNAAAQRFSKGASAASAGAGTKVVVSRAVYEVELALRYRYLMRPVQAPLSDAEKLHLHTMIYRYLVHTGLHRTAEVLLHQSAPTVAASAADAANGSPWLGFYDATANQALPGSPTAGGAVGASGGGRNGLSAVPQPALVSLFSEATKRTGLLFDDDSAWPSDALFGDSSFELNTVNSERGAPQCATLDALIEKAVLEQTDLPLVPGSLHMHFTNVFMITLPIFAPCPDVVFTKFAKLFKTMSLHAPLLAEPVRVAWQERLVLLLTAWLSTAQMDSSRSLLERALSFGMAVVANDDFHRPSVLKQASRLVQTAEKLLAAGWCGRAAHPFPALSRAAAASSATSGVDNPDRVVLVARGVGARGAAGDAGPTTSEIIRSVLDATPLDVAQQLCLVHHAQLCNVAPREFANAAWADENLKGFATGLVAFVRATEDVALWVASIIVTPTDAAERRKIYAHCIRIAQALFECQNFSMSRAFFNGVDHSSVTRLKDTTHVQYLTKEDTEALEAMRIAFDPFRGTMKDLPYNMPTACIPYIAPYLSDACKLHENHKTFVSVDTDEARSGAGGASSGSGKDAAGKGARSGNQPGSTGDRRGAAGGTDGSARAGPSGDPPTGPSAAAVAGGAPTVMINWSKMMQLSKVLLRIVSYQLVPYRFRPDAALQRLLTQLPGKLDADALHELSSEREAFASQRR